MFLAAIARPHMRPDTSDAMTKAVTQDGLVAWWKADEAPGATTMLDYSGNGNHATYNLSVLTHLVQGNAPIRAGSNACIQFTAIDRAPAAAIAASGRLNIGVSNTAPFTIAAFVKKLSSTSQIQKILGMGPDNFGVNENGPNIQYRQAFFPTNAGCWSVEANRFYSPNSTAGTVVFLALTYNGGGASPVHTLYENGTSVATSTDPYVTPHYSQVDIFGAGQNPVDTDYSLVGYGSDFLIYDKALNSTQLTAIAHAGGLV